MKQLLFFTFSIFFLFIAVPSVNAQIYTNEKMITVDLGSQKLTAWDQGKIVYETKVSTGMNLTPTVKGSFRVYFKTPLQDM